MGLISICVLMLACRSPGNAATSDREELSGLEDITTWFITEGVGEYFSKVYNSKLYLNHIEDDPLVKRINQEFNAYTRAVIIIDSENSRHSLFSVASASGKYSAVAENYVRYKTATGVYEYWVVKIGNRDKTNIQFILAQAPSMGASRNIVFRSKRFLESYTFEDGQQIDFPDSNVVVSTLLPYLYPEAFAGTKLDGKQVRWIQDSEPTRLIEVEIVDGQWKEKKTDGAKQLHFIDDKPIEFVYKDGKLIKK